MGRAEEHQLEAVERRYLHGWSHLDKRLRFIVEGAVVFASLFDDSPAVHRAFCPARSAYTEGPAPGEPRPLAPIDTLLESGKVLALNFPVRMNPGLARILGVMLKLDFQRAVLQRIPQISPHPKRTYSPARTRTSRPSRVCCRIARGFALDEAKAVAVLRDWNARWQPPWQESELRDKHRHALQYGREPVGGLLYPERPCKVSVIRSVHISTSTDLPVTAHALTGLMRPPFGRRYPQDPRELGHRPRS